MISTLHGKHYYIESKSYDEIYNVICRFIDEEKDLKDERFNIICAINYKGEPCHAIYSDCGIEHFRGKKYRAWERVKRKVYMLRKEGT